MGKEDELTVDALRAQISYDPTTGEFVWKERRRGRRPGAVGSHNSHGYFQIMIDGRNYLAHRLAWLYVHGAWPRVHVDHIDGDGTNNRIANLREATPGENAQNKRLVTGATWHKGARKWMAQIVVGGVHHHLGLHPSAEAAHAAYVEAKRRLHPFGTL